MKMQTLRWIIFSFIFVITVLVVSILMNQGNFEMSVEMQSSTTPYIRMIHEDVPMNYLLGNYQEMEVGYQRNSITPIGYDRKLIFEVLEITEPVVGISYEVRSVDGSRLIESTEITEFQQVHSMVSIETIIKDLIEPEVEYALKITLEMETGEPLYYYTKIIETEDTYAEEKIEFVKTFHEATLQKENTEWIIPYIEPNVQGDNTNFYEVDIHSSLSQIMWADLEVSEANAPLITIHELGTQTGTITVESLIEVQSEQETFFCKVHEYYRVRYVSGQIYLLDYERRAEQIIDMNEVELINSKIVLGIADPEIELIESEGGDILAFTTAGALYSYNKIQGKLSCLYNYFDPAHSTMRDYIQNNEIKILSVEETGNVRFLVYGYKNRGNREGYVGVQIYYYDSTVNTIEEEIYIPYNHSASILSSSVNELAYLSKNNYMYLMLDQVVYEIDITRKTYEIIIGNLVEDTYFVSETNEMIVWETGDTDGKVRNLTLMNLNTGTQTTIKAPYGELILPQGFIGNDLVYGLVKESDVIERNTGNTYPMYALHIQSQEGSILKAYEEVGIYIEGTSIQDGYITISCLKKNEETGNYTEIGTDQILNNESETVVWNEKELVTTDSYKKIIQVKVKTSATEQLTKTVPEVVLYEGERSVALNWDGEQLEQYFVYVSGKMEEAYLNVSSAVQHAVSENGVVSNSKGQLIWEPGNLATKNQIMNITEQVPGEFSSQLAECLDVILAHEGILLSTESQVLAGKDAVTILSQSLKDFTVLDLGGCQLENMKFYLDKDMPILVVLNDEESIILTGYNETEVVVYDPATGKLNKESISSLGIQIEESGNHFISYMTNQTEG